MLYEQVSRQAALRGFVDNPFLYGIVRTTQGYPAAAGGLDLSILTVETQRAPMRAEPMKAESK
ncbi:hypothetical protein [Diaphorobacter ruginosibacter]|uniref:hypothetical protein n=1 Tax=Diaphorobacter ruginosibacter TaxID=1715720 RepID=UPI00333EA11A